MSTDGPGEKLPEELSSLEAALRQLTPQAGHLDRDRLMYLAGQASAQKFDAQRATARLRSEQSMSWNPWQLATAALALLAITLGGLLFRSTPNAERVAAVESARVDGTAPGATSLPVVWSPRTSLAGQNADYFQLRNLVLTRGIDALPTTPTSHRTMAPPATPLPTLRQEFLGNES